MIQRPQPYIRQLFTSASTIATVKARRAATADRKKLSKSLEKSAKERNLKGKVRVVRKRLPRRLRILDPTLMIWPEGLWYMKVTKTDVPQIVDTYLKLEESDQRKEAESPAGKVTPIPIISFASPKKD